MSEKDLTIVEKLILIQNEIKVPKSRTNNYAQKPYNYRNAEDILSAVKPVAANYGCVVTLTDDVVLIGNRYYFKATATLADGKDKICTDALARECESRKGFDEAQLSGSASSYARKFALNGLLGLDDNEDPDHKDNSQLGKDKSISCPVCGKEVIGFKAKNGKFYNPRQIINGWGMCLDCYKKHND